MKKLIRLLLIITVLILVVGYAIGNKLITTVYVFESDKVEEPVTIIQLTDFYDNLNDLEEVLYVVTSQSPDYVVLTGDIFYDEENYEQIFKFIKNLTEVSTVIYIRGHSDSQNNQYRDLKHELTINNVVVLENDYVDFDNIRFIGIEDNSFVTFLNDNNEQALEIESTLSTLIADDKYNIVLSHRPQYFEQYYNANSDLVLSGHTNGGGIRVPFTSIGLMASDQGFLPEYDYGLFEKDQTKMIINAGLSENAFLPRFYNPKEVVLIRIK